jgi:hypothetical protein
VFPFECLLFGEQDVAAVAELGEGGEEFSC